MDNILEYKGFRAEINFSASDKILYGKILGISDLVSFEGESVTGIQQAFEEAVDDYLATVSNSNTA